MYSKEKKDLKITEAPTGKIGQFIQKHYCWPKAQDI